MAKSASTSAALATSHLRRAVDVAVGGEGGFGGLGGGVIVGVEGDDLVAAGGERARDGEADALGPAADERARIAHV